MDEAQAMAHAIELAWRGWGRVHPNPMVGAVLLAEGRMVGEGFHAEFGGPHAETVALAAAGRRAAGATAVVTLEPCTHVGKQPPCADALIRAGVRRVVAAVRDPDPLAQGGAQRMQGAGIDVEIGLMGSAAAAQNAAFFHALRDQQRPWIALKLATTIDGRIADARGRSRWISGPDARDYVHWLRAGFDAIATGGRTAAQDDPSLTVRGAVTPRVTPRRIIFDRALGLSPTSVVARTAADTPTIVVTATGAAGSVRADALRALGVQVLGAASLAEAAGLLRSGGITSMLVEGGGRLAGALLEAGLVDRYYWIQSPVLLGAGGVPAFAGVPDAALPSARRWVVAERRALGEDTLLVVDREPCLPEL